MAMEIFIDVLECWIYAEFVSHYLGYKLSGAARRGGIFLLAVLLLANVVLADFNSFFHWSTIMVDLVIVLGYRYFFSHSSCLSCLMSVALFNLGIVASVTVSMCLSVVLSGSGFGGWMEVGTAKRAALLILSKLLLAGYAYGILRVKKELGHEKNRMVSGAILISPVLVVVMASLIIQILLQTYEINKNANIYVLLLAGIVAMVTIAFYLADYALKREAEASKSKMLKELLGVQKQMFRKEISGYEKLRKTEHDMKNHLVAIRYYFEKDDTSGGLEYLEKLMPQVKRMEEPEISCASSDSLWEAMIDLKLSEAKEKGIMTGQKLFPGRYERIDALDLCVILGNLLDNAIEAEERNASKKEIFVELKETCGVIKIQIRNWVDSDHLAEAGRMISCKEDSFFHGLGLQNVKETVEKYDGRLKNEIMDNYFISQTVLPCSYPNLDEELQND